MFLATASCSTSQDHSWIAVSHSLTRFLHNWRMWLFFFCRYIAAAPRKSWKLARLCLLLLLLVHVVYTSATSRSPPGTGACGWRWWGCGQDILVLSNSFSWWMMWNKTLSSSLAKCARPRQRDFRSLRISLLLYPLTCYCRCCPSYAWLL